MDDGGGLSRSLPVGYGVPQESVLWPLLFALYISDIGQHIAFSNNYVFADDLQIYSSCKPDEIDSATSKINSDIDTISRCAEGRNLNINIGKTKAIMFGSRVYLNNIAMFPSLFLYGNVIEFSDSVKKLGVEFDQTLSWRYNVVSISNKVFK